MENDRVLTDDPVNLRELIELCRRLDHSLESNKIEMKRRTKALLIAVAAAIVVACVGLGVGWAGVQAADRANAGVRATDLSRAEARYSGCVQANVNTENQRAALVLGLTSLADDMPLSPLEQDLLDRFTVAVEEALPYRDCSPAGIDAYYRNPPQDPAAP